MEFLEKLRQQVDDIDKKLLELLAQRQIIVTEIGNFKKEHGLKIIDSGREQKKIAVLQTLSRKYHLEQNFVKSLWVAIFKYARKLQK